MLCWQKCYVHGVTSTFSFERPELSFTGGERSVLAEEEYVLLNLLSHIVQLNNGNI
jgi:hypothetical protein